MNELKAFSSTEFGELGVMLIDGKEYFPENRSPTDIDPYKELANAIILQAVEDYRKWTKEYSGSHDDRKLRKCLVELKEFFRSEWFSLLTDLDGEQILSRLKNIINLTFNLERFTLIEEEVGEQPEEQENTDFSDDFDGKSEDIENLDEDEDLDESEDQDEYENMGMSIGMRNNI